MRPPVIERCVEGGVETDLREYARSLIGWLTSPLGPAVFAATMSDAARAQPEVAEVEQRFHMDRLQRAEAMVTRAIARGELPADTDANAVIKTGAGADLPATAHHL